MAINFPNAPSVDDTFTSNNVTYIYDGVKWLASTESGAGGLENIVVVSNYNASANQYVYADTSSSSIDITLPSSPSEYDVIVISDESGSFSFNNVNVLRNGSTISGQSSNITLDLSGREYTFIFYNNTWNVFIKLIEKRSAASFSISGPDTANEGEDVILTISGYNSGATYSVQVTDGSFIRSADQITWSLPLVSQNKSVFVQVEESSASGTVAVSYEIQVFNIPTISDDSISTTDFSVNSFNDGWII